MRGFSASAWSARRRRSSWRHCKQHMHAHIQSRYHLFGELLNVLLAIVIRGRGASGVLFFPYKLDIALYRLPVLTAVVWRLRGVVIGIAVVQASQQGQPALAAVIGALGLVSYAMPVGQRRWQQQLVAAGDRAVTEAGLAGPLAAFLRRCPASPAVRARVRALDVAPPPARRIGLVGR